MSASSVPAPGGLASLLNRSQQSATGISPLWQFLKLLGSLKITVVAFFLATCLVLFGTLAQDQQDLSDVKRLYFNAWLSVVPFDVFLPTTIFPHDKPLVGAFPFPGGATLGVILMINLIAAKLTRFHVEATGSRLAAGLVISLLGAGLVLMVIISGHSADGLQGAPPISYDTLWGWLKAGMVLLTAVLIFTAIVKYQLPMLARIALWTSAGCMTLLSVFLLMGGQSVRLDDPGLRIVWQLLQSGVASAVVLAGLILVFGNRGGNVLIHVGVALMMLGQFIFGDRQIEQRMSLIEGQQTNLVFRQDELELALIDTSDTKEDFVTAIPEARLRRAADSKQIIDAPELPCRIRLVEWMPNSALENIAPDAKNPATAGIGLKILARAQPKHGGAVSKTNLASAYIELLDKSSDQSLGTYLVTQHLNDQKQVFVGVPFDQNEQVTVAGKSFEVGLRFRRAYKPFDVLLEDVERKDYEASDRPRDFSSHILIRDREEGTELKGHVWMNNPVRYRGETFYQSEYNMARSPNGQMVEMTGLQVVENAGWIIPYVSCMLVLLGMISHFSGTFFRFASRLDRGAIPTAANKPVQGESGNRSWAFSGGLIATAVGLQILLVGMMAAAPRSKDNEYDWYAAGKIPVMHEGRIKPLDSVARHVLQTLSEPLFGMTPQVTDDNGVRRTGTAWLLALWADKPWAADAKVFRIYSQEGRDFFDLEPVSGFRYSYNELKPKSDELRQHLEKFAANPNMELSAADQKLQAVMRKLQLYEVLYFSYRLPPLPDENSFPNDAEGQREFVSRLRELMDYEQRIESSNPPALLPPEEPQGDKAPAGKWQAYSPAIFAAFLTRKPNPAILKYSDIADAIRFGDPKKFNKSVSDYIGYVQTLKPQEAVVAKAATETWLNKFNPTAIGVGFYLTAFVLALVSFLSSSISIRRTTYAILIVTVVVHTIAILARIYVSGRPPVVNLYSSAVFIGWACVIGSLLLELIYPLGICNLAAAIIGATTLSIARSLDTSDTMHVLDAVLDTQFWLSTHVITVTLGYGATFLAGIIGIIGLSHRMKSRMDATAPEKRLPEDLNFQAITTRMIYGVLCFAILFSFIGTVLGGLWADDSWGRFWGWDPKENGALMIVLWNALVLHANWDRMVGQRGLAVLAVLGNIVTSWSWFGTNQLGIGLHSYGFTSAMLITLTAVVLGHLLFVGASLFFTRQRGISERPLKAA